MTQHVGHRRSDEIAQLNAEIERLRAECNGIKLKLSEARTKIGFLKERAEAAGAEVERQRGFFHDAVRLKLEAQAERDGLRKALEPFTEAGADLIEGTEDYEDGCGIQLSVGRTTHYALKLGDFRRAAALRPSAQELTKGETNAKA